ncbi:MAG: hypothetical protein KC492_26390 [Myxococcales bacterium]|nr:hypothetical protein [Myxococcales bacterium]
MLIASGFNHWFVKRSLQVANVTMRQRGRVVSPVVKLYRLSPDLSQDFAIRALLVVLGSGGDVWPKEQLDVLRYTQMTLQLDDAAIGALERDLDAGLEPLLADANLSDSAKQVLEDYLVLASACYPTDTNDGAYAKQLVPVRGSGEAELKKRIADQRRRIS